MTGWVRKRDGGRGRLLADVRPLRESVAFRRLWIGSTLSAVGGALTQFAVPLQVYEITRSPFAVGAIGVAQVVPTVAIGLLGGAVADAVDRRKLVLVASCGSAAVSGGLAAQAFAGLRSVWLLYALVAVSSSLSAINAPVRRTFVASLLPADQLTAGLALQRLTFQIMLTAGPALAGLITATPGLGLRSCYLIDAASFGCSLYGVARLPVLPRTAGAARPGLRAVADGLRFIGHSRILLGAFLADLNATIFGLPVALFPAINAERFGGDPRTLGLFTAAIGVGGLVTAALSGPVGQIERQGRAMLGAVAIWGAAFAGFAVAPTLWLTLVMLALAGAADTFTVVFRGAIVQQSTPDDLRGRVTAADYVVGVSGGSLGNLEAGALGSLTSPVVSALAGGLVTVAGAAVIGLALPAFTRYQRQPRAELAAHGAGGLRLARERRQGGRRVRPADARDGQDQLLDLLAGASVVVEVARVPGIGVPYQRAAGVRGHHGGQDPAARAGPEGQLHLGAVVSRAAELADRKPGQAVDDRRDPGNLGRIGDREGVVEVVPADVGVLAEDRGHGHHAGAGRDRRGGRGGGQREGHRDRRSEGGGDRDERIHEPAPGKPGPRSEERHGGGTGPLTSRFRSRPNRY